MKDEIISQPPPDAPFRCPHCSRWCNEIASQLTGQLLIMYHGGAVGCKKILSTQVVQAPQPKVQPAGLILPSTRH